MTLVSAIMPTRGRPEMARKAVECFLEQTYPTKELIILDDSDEPSFQAAPAFEGIRYHRLTDRRNIAWKRNEAIRLAGGEIIMHWDSDDWSDRERMAQQVAFLEQSGKHVTGYNTLLFCECVSK